MRKATYILILMVVSATAHAQEQKPYNWSIGAGAGLFHYINTLEIGADLAKTNHMGYTFRFSWEPEHRLSMSFESGYYTIYSMERAPSGSDPGGNAKLSAVPLLLSFRIRVLPNFFLSGGPGMTIMYSDVTVLDNTSNSSFLSLANLHIAAMYQWKLNDRFNLGTEVKFLNFGKTEDYGFSLQVIGSYRFRLKK